MFFSLILAFELTVTFPIVLKPACNIVEEVSTLIYDWAVSLTCMTKKSFTSGICMVTIYAII